MSAGLVLGRVAPLILALLVGWDVAAVVYLTWVWWIIWPLDAEQTARLAAREDPSRTVRDGLLLLSCVASLLAIPAVLVTTHRWHGPVRDAGIALGVASVIISWIVVHTVFTARYAGIYYGKDGGIDFHQEEPPRYTDFAYVAFTVGTTFQVSDTDLTSTAIRVVVLRHLLLSYAFGAVLIAATVNLLAGLAR
ncbi:MAG TPA: DUF1345 domain-containing protein [Micromonosporaceae bacterium]